RLSVGVDRPSRRSLRHDLDPGARLHRPLHARHREGLVDLADADPSRARGGLLDLRHGPARHDPVDRAAARATRRDRRADPLVHSGDPRARLVPVPLHQQHHGDGRPAARLLRGRQSRDHRGLQPGPDGAARGADRDRPPSLARRRRRRRHRPHRLKTLKEPAKGGCRMAELPSRFRLVAMVAAGLAAAGAAPALAQNVAPPALLEAARQEGKMIYYTANFTEVEQETIKAFNKRFPFVNIELVRAPGGQLITRVKTEAAAGKLAADVVDHSDRALMKDLVDLFQDYAPPN